MVERMEAVFRVPVVEVYAMTEAAHLMATNPLPTDGPSQWHRRLARDGGSGEDGARLPVGKAGEVCV